MRVLVTGGSGRIGSATVQELLSHGYGVVNADQRPPSRDTIPEGSDYRYQQTDLGDVGQVAGALSGCDALIHLGAIPSPYRHPDEVVFLNNVGATFAALQAAMLLGVKKAVIASSLSALGTAWAPEPFPPLYAPVDEAHPLLPHDCYGLSKEVDERTAEMFHRRTGMQILAYRFPLVASMAEIKHLAEIMRENPAAQDNWKVLWAYIDVRDAALACRLGIEADGLGFDVFNISAADTVGSAPTEDLIKQYAPSVEIRHPLPGTATAFSFEKARRLIGYEPQYTWRNQ
ncbi:MAG TPA: NAD(P)-dependent oxidoreductase [Thermomicrobiales bacterium]|nr:NAD(P)-dependent oxidoreductase [Thermomicrobiales bacterium]